MLNPSTQVVTHHVATAHHIAAPVITKEQRTQIVKAIQHGYRQGGLTTYGFSTTDLANYFFGRAGKTELAEAEAIQRNIMGQKQTLATAMAGLLVDKKRIGKGPGGPGWGADITWGLQHLAEHQKGSHYTGDFNIGSFISSAIGVITFGTAPDFTSFFSALGSGRFDIGKIQFNVPFSGAQVNKYTHDWVGLYTGGQLNSAATPILDSNVAKILDTVAGATAGAVAGSAAFSFGSVAELGGVAQVGAEAGEGTSALAGVTEASLEARSVSSGFQFGDLAAETNYAKAGVTSASLAEAGIVESTGSGLLASIGNGAIQASKFLGGAVVAGYVQKIIGGGTKAIGDLLKGNVQGAIKDVVGSVTGGGGQPQPQGQGGGSIGGGGGGYGGGYGGSVGQSSMLTTLLPLGLLLIVGILLAYLYKRKH